MEIRPKLTIQNAETERLGDIISVRDHGGYFSAIATKAKYKNSIVDGYIPLSEGTRVDKFSFVWKETIDFSDRIVWSGAYLQFDSKIMQNTENKRLAGAIYIYAEQLCMGFFSNQYFQIVSLSSGEWLEHGGAVYLPVSWSIRAPLGDGNTLELCAWSPPQT